MGKGISTRPTRMYVDLSAIAHNVKSIKEKLGAETGIMAVVKASGYGSGVKNIINTLVQNGVTRLAVATTEEGCELRENGIGLPVLVITQPFEEDLIKIANHNLIPAISDFEVALELDKMSQRECFTAKCHVEIDTGMGRMGIRPEEAVKFISKIKDLKNIEIEGVFTHFACSDTDVEYTKMQISRFDDVLRNLQEAKIHIPVRHACNSAAIINFPQAHYDFVRPGLMLYGYYPDESLREKIELKPSLTLKSKIIFIKEAAENTPLSYNCTFITKRKSLIATVPIGYADGYKRFLSNRGVVVINGEKAPVVGMVCMDMIMVDVTDIKNVKLGDEVIIFDDKNITVENMAKECGTINYEIISTVGNRVPRIYL